MLVPLCLSKVFVSHCFAKTGCRIDRHIQHISIPYQSITHRKPKNTWKYHGNLGANVWVSFLFGLGSSQRPLDVASEF